MTSRTPMGAQSHAHHQRALSGSAAQAPAQRPSPQQQRSISQSQTQSQANPPSSPLRRDASSTDQSADSPELAQIRVATPIRTGSRLRQELYNESRSGTPSATGSPPSLTPSRVTTAVASADEESAVSPTPSQDSNYDPENPPLPMPKRSYNLVYDVVSTKPPPAPPAKRDGRPKQYSIDTPSEAPRYQKPNKPETIYRDPFGRGLFSNYADFFPWNGNHHEDEWTMEAIQKGTWDRGSQSEVSSARLAVMPSLRQKTGLNALSTIFMGVMNQRRNSGYLTAPSTFKPPPRVTLTDSKREIWLKDLANPAIPLRRLSRTIPHGIRGKTLLDQCLNKHVPTERAVWLAKCVGANEIRSFKRKGGGNGAFAIGGEFKWIREWTIFVEQFVESVVSAFTETDWKHRVTYSIRLATVLYAEHLLDRDHYLDWIITGLETSSQSRIPMWILIAQICWSDLLSCRKYGRRLVFALANHLDGIHNDPDSDILIQLSSQLVTLLATLIKENTESFVQPTLWIKYQNTLQDSLPLSDRSVAQAFDGLNIRNANLLASKSTSASTGSQRVVQLLDDTIQGPRDPKLAAKCWASQSVKSELIKTTVDWATSSHRPGFGKIYVAAALIREWSTLRTDSTSAILDSLDSVNAADSKRKYMVYRLVTELVRSGHFSVPQYIQWLIARGSCHDASEIDPQIGSCSSRLLVELPIYCLPEERKRDRANLLRRAANFDVAEEARDIDTAKQIVDQMLNLVPPSEDDSPQRRPISLRKLLNLIRNSSSTLQTALSAHLRDLIMKQQASKLNSDLTLATFASLRAILETIGDFTMLADVIVACIRMSNVGVLSACVDTIHVNLDVFFAMDRAEELFDLYFEKLKIFGREHGLIARPLLSSLSALAQRMPDSEAVAKELRQELLQSDKSNAIDACSPISDNMVTQSQGVEGEVSEQIDKLLASGTSVDHPTMNRLFRNIIPLLEIAWSKCDETRRSFATLLGRLRVFDTLHFDKLMGDWLSHVRTLKERKPLADLFPLMINLGCLPVSIVLQTAAVQSNAADGSEAALAGCAVYLQELLQIMLSKPPKSTPMNDEEAYRFSIYQHAAKSEHSRLLLSLIRNAIMEYSDLKARHTDLSLLLDDLALQNDVLDTLRLLVVLDSAAVAEALRVKELTTVAAQLVRTIVVKLLIPDAQDKTSASFDQILGLANEMTMPFCQLTLNLELSLGQSSAEGPDGSTLSQFDIFAQAMDKAIEARNIMWTSMLPCLSDDITQHLKSQAHGRFLDLIPSTKSDNIEEVALGEDRIQLAKNLLGVIEAIASGQPSAKSSPVTNILADKLSDLWDLLTTKDERVTRDIFKAVLEHWLPTLLRLISLYSNVPEAPSLTTPALGGPGLPKPISTINHEPRARVVLTLCAILLDLEARSIDSTPALEQQLFDVAMLLADGLPDDLKTQCAKSVIATPIPTPSKTATSDPRVYYLLSALPSSWADNLLFAHRDKSSLPHSAAARGLGAMYGIGPTTQERYSTFSLRRWEVLSEPTPNVGENDTSLSMALFETIKIE